MSGKRSGWASGLRKRGCYSCILVDSVVRLTYENYRSSTRPVLDAGLLSGIRAEREAMPPSVTGETMTSKAPVETEIDEAFMPSVRLGFRRSFFLFAFEIGCRR